jgi:hypothetical protein
MPERRAVAIVVALIGLACAGAAVHLWLTLPRSYHAAHWRTAWTLFDVLQAGLAIITAVLVVRGSRWTALPASAACFGFLVDALFDCLTAQGNDTGGALRDLLGEIPSIVVFGFVAVSSLRAATSDTASR